MKHTLAIAFSVIMILSACSLGPRGSSRKNIPLPSPVVLASPTFPFTLPTPNLLENPTALPSSTPLPGSQVLSLVIINYCEHGYNYIFDNLGNNQTYQFHVNPGERLIETLLHGFYEYKSWQDGIPPENNDSFTTPEAVQAYIESLTIQECAEKAPLP